MSSNLSSGVDNVSTEGSTSISDGYPTSPSKLVGHGGNESLDIFKGIVLQQHGSWGAQIYANGHRIWLGTFKSEKEAAMAYDSAAILLRCGDSHRNFPWTSITSEEPNFQSQYSQEDVLEMIKDGSYQPKFKAFLRACYQITESGICSLNFSAMHKRGGYSRKLLFRKLLTLSDVGRLNRIVIPKKDATTYFPEITQRVEDDAKEGVISDVQVDFLDTKMRSWKFRYCYWRSSQSYVFTRGWSRFVKDKQLKVNDVVAFYLCEVQRGGNIVEKFFMIDPCRGQDCGSSSSSVIEVADHNVGLKPELYTSIFEGADHNRVGLKPELCSSVIAGADHNVWWKPELCRSVFEGADHHVELKPELRSDLEKKLEEEMMEVDPPSNVEMKGFRLFGVQIN